MMKKAYGLIVIALLTFSCSDDKKEIIAKWIDDSALGVSTITIYQIDNMIYLENWNLGRRSGKKELTKEERKGN